MPLPSSFTCRRSLLATTFAALAALCLPGVALSQTYPDKAVKLVVPYPPGGATDVIGRVLAQKLGAALGQQFVVENRAGAAGSLGAGQVGKATPDGYTLLMGALTSHSISAALNAATVPYDINKSFAPVSIVGTVPLVFVVNPEVKATSLGELIALAKAQPGKLAFASAGNGSPQHLATEMFKRMAGVDVLHVPYKGSGPAMTDLMGGQVQAMIETAPAAQGHIKNGKLRALATTTSGPVASLPGLRSELDVWHPGARRHSRRRRHQAQHRAQNHPGRQRGTRPVAGTRRHRHPHHAGRSSQSHSGRICKVGQGDQGRQHQGRLRLKSPAPSPLRLPAFWPWPLPWALAVLPLRRCCR
jgi:tripartite-type tricarboxylate transporter receptor subunit TctC